MSDEDALLTAIAAHPDEDTPRLMYADWLDEHGQPLRAEFIRVQIEIARNEHLPRARYADLFQRNRELLVNQRAELLGPLTALPTSANVEIQRGFVSVIELPVRAFLSHSALVAAQRPRPQVSVTGILGRLLDFLLNPHTDCVTHFRGRPEHPDDMVPQYPDDEDADLIDLIERMTRLEALDLNGCRVTDLHCDLAFNFSVPSLRTLDLSNNLITDGGVLDLLRTDLPRQLAQLSLAWNRITNVGALALAERWPSGAGDKLEKLNLRYTQIEQGGRWALLARFGGRVDLF
jgi:uncharacterized protein (TIGR02996 family)